MNELQEVHDRLDDLEKSLRAEIAQVRIDVVGYVDRRCSQFEHAATETLSNGLASVRVAVENLAATKADRTELAALREKG